MTNRTEYFAENRPPESEHALPLQGRALFQLQQRVYWEDTDASGLMYHANYLRFCERARTEWVLSRGIAQRQWAEHDGMAFVVRAASLDFLAPARLGDAVLIDVRFLSKTATSITLHQQILLENLAAASVSSAVPAPRLLFEARVHIVCVQLARQKPTRIPQAVLRQLGLL